MSQVWKIYIQNDTYWRVHASKPQVTADEKDHELREAPEN